MNLKSFALLVLSSCFVSLAAELPKASEALEAFQRPTRHFSTGPLWVWNDMLTEQQIRETLQDLAGQQVKQVWVHPRPGLMTPYLSTDWFRLWRVALAEAEKLDMNVWIYDENSYPSGFGGGFVPEAMPESRGRGLKFEEAKCVKDLDGVLGVYDINAGHSNVTGLAESKALPEGSYLVAREVRAKDREWTAGGPYVNLLSPGVTEKFIELTMEPYRRELGDQFGKRIPGVFTDEPNIRPIPDALPWSEVLAAEFQKRWGYNLMEHLPSLEKAVGDWRKVRHNYFQLLHEQFVERWAKPNHEYCATNNLEWTGHYWDHRWPNCQHVPDSMAMYAWHQRPAIDCLMNQYREDTHSQFGNLRMVRELSSVANQLGIQRTLCEIYGAGGWDLRFEDMKRIGDWLEVLGVNTLNEHLSYVTIRGARKRDHPQSFSYHEPWWQAYHVSAAYFTRLSAALSQGAQENRVLVLEPTTTAWMYQGDEAKLKEIGDTFFNLLTALEAAQIEYDLADEDIIARHGAPGSVLVKTPEGAKPSTLRIGQREYDTLVIPTVTENLNSTTVRLLDQVLISKYMGIAQPTRVDGQAVSGSENLEGMRERARTNSALLTQTFIEDYLCKQRKEGRFVIDRAAGDRGKLFHMRRTLADGELLFLVNTSNEHTSAGVVLSQFPGVEVWNLETGAVLPYPSVKHEGGSSAKFELPPCGSLLLCYGKTRKNAEFPGELAVSVPTDGRVSASRTGPNVLTLDYVNVTAGGETKSNMYFYPAGQFVWKKNGLERNPWDSAVQFRTNLISRTFPEGSGFEASYTFEIRGAVPRKLEFVLERPDLYAVTCNGKPVFWKGGKWWLDKAFGRMDISRQAHAGKNIVTIKATPFTMFHELEPAYVLGDFALEPAEKGFVIVPDHPLELRRAGAAEKSHSTDPEETMWLSGGIGFKSGKDDRAPFVVFDLGRTVDLRAIQVWNYNETGDKDLSSRSAKAIRISAGPEKLDGQLPNDIGVFALARGTPEGRPEMLDCGDRAGKVRYVRFDFLGNYDGISFPFESMEKPKDNGFVGLAEVKFLQGGKMPLQPISGVTVASVSGELPSHNRLAKHLVDGAGLVERTQGWNSQGFPFYSGGVAYRQRFDAGLPAGRYVVSLPKWLGGIAKVRVNGKEAGWISAPPYECDVTGAIRRGRNEVDVTVIGTLKNTLGPHHGNPVLGASWPRHFHKGPESGPPRGTSYSTIGYGLFEPMVVKNLVQQPPQTAAK